MLRAPLEALHVDMGVIDELDAVGFEEGDLFIAPAKRERIRNASVLRDDPVARNAGGVRIHMQGISDDARPPRVPRERSDLPVRGNLPLRDLPYDIINELISVGHRVHLLTKAL